jgi:hypothetical protein
MLAAALFVLAQAAPAPARPSPVPTTPAATPAISPERADARCLAAFGMLASNQQADVQKASQMGALYFYGKLLGRNPGVNLSTAMLEAARAVAPDVRGELTRCGGELQKSGEAMQAVGSSMTGAAPAPRPMPSPTPTARPRR